MKRWTALVLAVVLAGCLCACQGTAPAPVPSPQPTQAPPTVALLASREDPWCEALYDELALWFRENGWRLVAYDCRDNLAARDIQAEDAVRVEKADVAVVCPLAADTAEGLEALLDGLKKSQVAAVVLSPQAELAGKTAACSIAPSADKLYAAAAGAFRKGDALLLVAELPEDAWVAGAREALAGLGLTVADYGACWGSAQYAREYVERALPIFPEVKGALAASLPAALGAKEALGEGRVLCLEDSPQAREALQAGQIDGIAAVDVQDALAALEEVIPQAQDGKAAREVELEVKLLTP